MRGPTHEQIEYRIAAAIERLAGTKWRAEGERVLEVWRRDISASTKRDGFPGASGGGRGSGPMLVVDDENGMPDSVPLTSVEAAVEGLGSEQRADVFHDQVVLALDMLDQAFHSAGALLLALDRAEAVTGKPAPERGQFCEPCLAAGLVEHKPNAGLRHLEGMPAPMHICSVLDAYIRRHKHVPTGEQIRHHRDRGSWQVRVDPTQVGASS